MREKDKKVKSKYIKRILVILAAVLLLLVCACIAVLVLFRQVPESYVPVEPAEPNMVIPVFVTRDIAATIYNQSQMAEPFDLVVPQDEINAVIINEAVTGLVWPVEINGVTISSPAITFEPGTLSAMATINYAGFPMVATIIAEPKLSVDGMLHLNIRKVKAGAVDITTLASKLASGIFAHQAKEFPDEPFIKMLAEACLENKPIDPVFIAFDKQIRIISTDLQSEKLTLRCKRDDPKKLTTNNP